MLKKMIMLILPVLVLICFAGCAEKKQCTLIVTISGDGFSEGGEPLGSVTSEETFTVKKGDKFYETSPGYLTTEKSDPDTLLFQIIDIGENSVTMKYYSKGDYLTETGYKEIKKSFGTSKKIESKHTVCDERNYDFKLRFEKDEPQ